MDLPSIFLFMVFLFPSSIMASEESREKKMIFSLVRYISQDYEEAVNDKGEVVSELEYKEILEFLKQIEKMGEIHLSEDETNRFKEMKLSILQKKPPKAIRALFEDFKTHLEKRWPQEYPDRWPSVEEGRDLYRDHCSSCHGSTGQGDGPLSANLVPKPRSFDKKYIFHQTPKDIYDVLAVGVPGTAMPDFAFLSPSSRWALAFYVFAGETMGKKAMLPFESASSFSSKKGSFWEERNISPRALWDQGFKEQKDPQKTALKHMQNSLHLRGFSLTEAYLQHVEPWEGRWKWSCPLELKNFEEAFLALQETGSLQDEKKATQALLELMKADELNGEGSWWQELLSAMFVIWREGFEAFLIVMSLLTFINSLGEMKKNRSKIWIHMGWVSALFLGSYLGVLFQKHIVSWGSQRELMEVSLTFLAVALLLYASLTQMKNQPHLLKENFDKKATLFLLAFTSIFREMLEVVMLLSGIHPQGLLAPNILLGAFLGMVAVFITGQWIMKKTRKNLRFFFKISNNFMLLFAFTLSGQATYGAIKAGVLPPQSLSFCPTWPWLGVYPYTATLGVQLIVGLFILFHVLRGPLFLRLFIIKSLSFFGR